MSVQRSHLQSWAFGRWPNRHCLTSSARDHCHHCSLGEQMAPARLFRAISSRTHHISSTYIKRMCSRMDVYVISESQSRVISHRYVWWCLRAQFGLPSEAVIKTPASVTSTKEAVDKSHSSHSHTHSRVHKHTHCVCGLISHRSVIHRWSDIQLVCRGVITQASFICQVKRWPLEHLGRVHGPPNNSAWID